MPDPGESPSLIETLRDQQVVVDLKAPYVCIGTLRGVEGEYLELTDADLHDFRDGSATREFYSYDAARVGIRRNRKRVFIRRDEVVAVARLADLVET